MAKLKDTKAGKEIDWTKYIVKLVLTAIALAVYLREGDSSWLYGAIAPWGSDGVRMLGVVKGAKTLLVLGLLLGATSCGTLNAGFIMDSRDAIQSQGEMYLAGCRSVTVAPEVIVDLAGKPTFSGGVLIGCGDSGELAEFRCEYQEIEGARKLYCSPLTRWYSDIQEGD